MNLAVLFWFYKDPVLCENRLMILRQTNPQVKVYGLYGGPRDGAHAFSTLLGRYLDDFYVFSDDRPEHWKWYHGDQVISQWFLHRGHALPWDTIFIMQWDMLVFDNIQRLFPTLHRGQMLFSGLRPIREVDPWWWYIRPASKEREEYERFLEFIQATYGPQDDPWCGEFIVVCLPREFLSRYVHIPNPELGFLEYKMPIYAQIFGIPICWNHVYHPWWGDDPRTRHASVYLKALNSETQDVPLRVISAHLWFPWGRRIFHPVLTEYPLKSCKRWLRLSQEIYKEEFKRRWWKINTRLFGQP